MARIMKSKEKIKKDSPPNTSDMKPGDVAELNDSRLFEELNHRLIIMGEFFYYLIDNPDLRWARNHQKNIRKILPRGTVLKIII